MTNNNDVKSRDKYDVDYENYNPENVENCTNSHQETQQNQSPFSMPLNKNVENFSNPQFFEENSYKVVKKKRTKLKTKILFSLILLLTCLALVSFLATTLNELFSTLF